MVVHYAPENVEPLEPGATCGFPNSDTEVIREAVENAKGVPPLGTSIFDIEPKDSNLSPIEEVNLTVPISDDPTLPVWTFRTWILGVLFCALLAFLNQFFGYRTEPFVITETTAQVLALPLGQFMATVLPSKMVFANSPFAFSLNPGPFNIKEHTLITIFSSTGAGGVYSIGIVTIIKVFYRRKITFMVGLLVSLTTQLMGYGFAGLFQDYLIKPGVMWWPSTLVQVSLFRTLHDHDNGIRRSKWGYSRLQMFTMVTVVSFAWYVLPGYLFPLLSTFSWVCLVWPKSVVAQQLGSGIQGLGIGSISLDWSVISYLGSPLATPWFAIANVAVGYFLIMYVVTPIAYWSNMYNAKAFPIFSNSLFKGNGEIYDVPGIVNSNFDLDETAYNSYGKVHLSTFFTTTYGVGFATLTAAVAHSALFYGKDILHVVKRGNSKEDVHTRLMRAYSEVPRWWFHAILVSTVLISLLVVEGYRDQLQLPWWGVLLACALALFFTLPVAIIAATTNQVVGLNILAEYLMGYIYPGRPVANVCFKTYSLVSVVQSVSFLQNLKLGHYMKIPPVSMFVAQILGTVVAAFVYMGTAWWLLSTVDHICNVDGLLPHNSPWTCPDDRVFYDASVIWGLVGPKRIFGSEGLYKQVNWWFLVGAVAPIPVWLAVKTWPKVKFFRFINMPILIGATVGLPPATSVNFTMWILVGFVFQKVLFSRRKKWWARYNYIVSAGLDSGLAFMGVLLYFALQLPKSVELEWWGAGDESCPLASCPTLHGLGQPNPNCPAT